MDKIKRTKYVTLGFLAVLLLISNLTLPMWDNGTTEVATNEEKAVFYKQAREADSEQRVSSGWKPLSDRELSTVNRMAQDMILYYGCYGSKAHKKVDELLDAISEIDGGEGVTWKKIMDHWKYVNADLKINTSVPQGLPDGDNLCIIVLGYALQSNGSMSRELKGRLKTALACAEKYPNAYVMCTGGGTARNNKSVTEGNAMAEWMISHGVSKARLLTENQSKTTTENAVFCHEIIRRKCPQVDSVLLVSSSYHLPWGELMFEAEFLRSAEEKNTPEIHVVSNCAYPTSSVIYRKSEALRWQTGGMLELVGDRELADVFYGYRYRNYIRYKKPKL